VNTPPGPVSRCPWCGDDPLYVRYHDEEWGVPVHDDRIHFEFLILESFQAGLSWLTVLRKRENFRLAFDGFDVERVADYGEAEFERLMGDAGIIRNRAKIRAAIGNARAFLRIREEFGTFDRYIREQVPNAPIVNRFESMSQLPARTGLSDRIAADLKRRGFAFLGSTVIYAQLQATGLLNDHLVSCFRHDEVVGR
jgi:DNA-3-methyladenine glycosylase I